MLKYPHCPLVVGDGVDHIPLPWFQVRWSFLFFHVTFVYFACVTFYDVCVMRIEFV